MNDQAALLKILSKILISITVFTLISVITSKNVYAEIATASDWLGLFESGKSGNTKAATVGGNSWHAVNENNSTNWLSKTAAQSENFTVPSVPGAYEFRYNVNNTDALLTFTDGTDSKQAISQNFWVLGAGNSISFTGTSSCNTTAGDVPQINFSWITLVGVDHVSIYGKESTESTYSLVVPSALGNSYNFNPTPSLTDNTTYNYYAVVYPSSNVSTYQTGVISVTTPGCRPTLGVLNVTLSADSVEGTFGKSGLRDTERGSNYYNSIDVTQNVTSATNVKLEGVAFVQGSGPGNGSNLTSLINAVPSGSGFILIYANKAATVGSKTFTAGKYYVYFNSVWYEIGTDTLPAELVVSTTSSSNPPNAPKFTVTFKTSLGTKTWSTYSYMMKGDGTETSEAKSACNLATPVVCN